MSTNTSSPGWHLSHAWITVATFNNALQARRLPEFLTNSGITAQVQDEHRLQKAWFLARPLASHHVRVPELVFQNTQQFLATDPTATTLLKSAYRCPECNSTRVQYPQMTRKNVLPTLIAHFFVLVGVMRQECYCEDCHNSWVPIPALP